MDSQNDSAFFSRISKRATQNMNDSMIQNPRLAQEIQSKIKSKVSEVEISELKQSLRYVEIQLARTKEENETLTNKVNDQQNEIQLLEKNRFKAGGYMSEINQREEELGKMRAQLMNMQDDLKLLTVSREQFRQQVEALNQQVRERDTELDKLRKKQNEQNRLLDSMVVAQKNFQATGQYDSNQNGDAMDKARDDIERAERLNRTTNRSSFMSLGDKPPKLVSEEGTSAANQGLQSRAWNVEDPFKAQGDDTYLFDESIPGEIFPLLQNYRERLLRIRNLQNNLHILDDFFADVHKLLKDSQMREIAKIRNENSLEIMKLRKNLDKQLTKDTRLSKKQLISAKENFQVIKGGNEKFVENEIEKQRRALIEENTLLKKRLRAVETIVNSGNSERAKFMEGASWVAKKAHVETERHILKMQNLIGEFQRKTQEQILDEQIYEVNGKELLKVNKWCSEQIDCQISEVGEKFESIFENVNFHLKEAAKQFGSNCRKQ